MFYVSQRRFTQRRNNIFYIVKLSMVYLRPTKKSRYLQSFFALLKNFISKQFFCVFCGKIYLLEILLLLIILCLLHLKRLISSLLFFRCFWLTPEFTLFLQSLKLDSFSSERISSITSDSLIPNWNCIASNGVRSSHAISMILSISFMLRFLFIFFDF